MIRLKAGETPKDENLTVHVRVDMNPLHTNSDELWMTVEEWFSEEQSYAEIQDEEMRGKLQPLIEKWRDLALSHKGDENRWPVKYAAVKFYLQEGKFVIDPGTLGDGVDAYMFERAANAIEEDLREAGALYVMYSGMLD